MSKKIANAAILITLITLLSKFTGFFRDIVLANKYGTTVNSDAFIMAQSIVGVFTGLILSALGTTFIPIMADYLQKNKKQETNNFLSVIYTITLSLTIILCILGFVYTSELVNLFAPNFTTEAHVLTVQLTQILLPVIVLTAIVTLSSSKLQSHGSFLVPATIGFPMNFIMIITMFFFTESFGISGVAVAFVLGTLLQIILQYPFTKKLGYRFKVNFDINNEGLRKVGILIVPILIGSGIQQINTMVNQIMASGLEEGSIAALNFSNRLSLFIIGLLSAAIVSVFYTSMSKYFSAGQDELFKRMLKNTINISVIIILPASVGFIVLRLPIVKLIFERGMFDSTASEMTAVALLFYTIGLIGFLLRNVLSRAFYAIKDTKTAMINGSIAVILNIIFSLVLAPYMGLGGLALATSLSGIIGTLLLMFNLQNKIGAFGLKEIFYTFLKVSFLSVIMGFIVHYCYEFTYSLIPSNLLSVTLSILIGFLMYLVGIIIFKIEEINILKKIIDKRLSRS